MSDSQGEIAHLARAMVESSDKLEKATGVLEKLSGIKNGVDGNQNVTHVSLGNGGAALWACVTATIVSVVVALGSAILFVNMDRKIDRMQDHLNVIYQQAPWLKGPDGKNPTTTE